MKLAQLLSKNSLNLRVPFCISTFALKVLIAFSNIHTRGKWYLFLMYTMYANVSSYTPFYTHISLYVIWRGHPWAHDLNYPHIWKCWNSDKFAHDMCSETRMMVMKYDGLQFVMQFYLLSWCSRNDSKKGKENYECNDKTYRHIVGTSNYSTLNGEHDWVYLDCVSTSS